MELNGRDFDRRLGDIELKLKEIEGITHIYMCSPDQAASYGPTLGAVVSLAECALVSGEIAEGRLYHWSERDYSDSVDQVMAQIAELRELSVSFVLLWHVHGEHESRFDYSADKSASEMLDEMVNFLSGEVLTLIPLRRRHSRI
ncbi:MAG: hypothetical protein K8T91_14480 [Planctomycetes bacterium]|nr:hypothetical protein [Planctomycetota bacterium]